MGFLGDKYELPLFNALEPFYAKLETYLATMVRSELDICYVDASVGASGDGKSWENAKLTIQEGLNQVRRLGDGSTLDDTKDRHKFVLVWPGQYNEKIAFSGYNIHLIAIGLKSNGDYGVVINYDDAITADYVMAFSGAGLEIANICIQSTKAIPILYLADTSDAVYVHDCWIKGDNSKTVTIGIQGNIKNSIIENNIINGCITGINIANGAWFNNTIVRKNKITNVTTGINLVNGCTPTESEISDNTVVGSSASIVNGTSTGVVITGNNVYPDITDGGNLTGRNTLLAAEVAGDIESKIDTIDTVVDTINSIVGHASHGLEALYYDIAELIEMVDNGRDIWYVDSSIGASGVGSQWSTAFKTITEAVTAASAGDVIMIRGEFSSVTEGATINLNKELWLIGENTTSNQGCTMIYNGGAAAYPLVTVSAHQCKIFNIYFSQISTQNSIEVGAYWKCHIKGCKFDEAAIMINIDGDSPDTTIEDCLFRSWTTYAIDTYCTRAMIKNCRFIDVGSSKTAIRHTSDGGNRPDTAILDCRFITYDHTNGVAIEVTNTPTVGYLFVDGNHFAYFADDNHAVSKRTGYCGINWRDAAVLPVT